MQKNNDIDNAIYGSVHVQQYKTDVAFKSLVQGIEDNLYIIPDFQRVYRWTETQVEDLAVSLVKGMPIPPIYAYRNDENSIFYTLNIGNTSTGTQRENYSCIFAKNVILACSLCDSNIWPYNEEKNYVDFIIGIDENGKDSVIVSSPSLDIIVTRSFVTF